uniref:Interleukin-7 n=1 Tax=Stegastes partitus TaxID=144197 RepID=A0A3B4ZCA4_9TELE
MPLLCISVLVLLLLPPSLSCDSKRPAEKIQEDYMRIVEVDLNNTRDSITTLLRNVPCPVLKDKPPSCTSENVTLASTLYTLTCKMKNLGLLHTERLTMSILNSLHCRCLERPTKEPKVKLKKRTATGQRGTEERKSRKETRKLCRAQAMISNMTECYLILNSLLAAMRSNSSTE